MGTKVRFGVSLGIIPLSVEGKAELWSTQQDKGVVVVIS